MEENKSYKYLLTMIDAEGRQDTSVTGQFMVQATWTKTIKEALGMQPTMVKDMLLPIRTSIKDKQIPVAGRLYRITGTTDPTNTVIISTDNTPNITTVKPLEDGRFETEVYLPSGEEQIIVEVMSKGNLKRKLLTSDIRIDKEKDNYFFLAGIADVMAGSNSREGDEATLDEFAKNNVRYNKGAYTEYRIAAFMKSRSEDWTIAGSLDTERINLSHETRQLFKYLDPDKFYPMYGDNSTRIDEASNTQGPLYLKAEHRKGYGFLIGNYNTNLTGSELSQYNRSLYGLQMGYKTPMTDTAQAKSTAATLFVASANQMASRDEIRGTGGSLYYLKNKNIREGSEKIMVETRDKVSGLVTGSQILTAYQDYEIDYSGGRIILNKPLHSVGASNSIVSTDLLEGNPVYLAVDYEYEPVQWWDFNREAMGTRIVQTLDNLTIGATYVKEEKDLTDYTLMGTDIAAKLGKNMDARLEYAQSQSEGIPGYVSYNGGLDYASLPTASSAEGTAYKLTLGMDIGALMNKAPSEIMGKTYYAKTEAGFSSNATVSQQGSEKMGLEVGAKLTDNDTLLSRFDSQTVLAGANSAVQATAGASETTTLVLQIAHRQDPVRVTGEYRYQDTLTPYITPGLLRDEPSQILAGRVEYDMNKGLSVFGEQQAALAGKPNNQTTVGANMKLTESIVGNIQQTFGTLGNSTMFGLTTDIKEGTEKHSLYANYQITQDASGAQNYNVVIGEKERVSDKLNIYRENRFTARRGAEEGNMSALFGSGYTLSENWLMNATYERSQIDNLSQLTQSRDAVAAEAIYNSHPAEKDKSKIVGYMNGVIRIEARSEKGAQEKTSYLTANRLFYQANEDLSVSVKGYMSETVNQTTKATEAKFTEGGVAFAYRPVKYDKYNLIGKLNYLEDQATPAQSPSGMTTDTKAIVLALEGAEDVAKQLQIVEKVAYRKNIENVSGLAELDKDVSLFAVRFNYRLMSESKLLDKWVLGLEYRMLSVSLADDQRTGIVFEVDREMSENLIFGIGYNMVDFSDDLTTLGRDYKVKGAFIRLTAKY